jgi:hypothetical protein
MTNAIAGDDERTASRAEEVIERLTNAFNDLAATGSVRVKPGKDRVFLAAYGWWAYITRSSQAVLTLRRNGLEHEALPIVRSILQHALVLQWLADTGDAAIDAVGEYGDDNTRLLLLTMNQAHWPPIPGFNITAPPKLASPNPLVSKIKNFEELCVFYNARTLYAAFRLLSSYVHPTAVGAMAYVDQAAGTLADRATGPTGPNIIQAAICLIQAGHVISQLLQGDPIRTALTKAEIYLGTRVELWERPT